MISHSTGNQKSVTYFSSPLGLSICALLCIYTHCKYLLWLSFPAPSQPINSEVQSWLPSPQLQWIQRSSKPASQQKLLQRSSASQFLQTQRIQKPSLLTQKQNAEMNTEQVVYWTGHEHQTHCYRLPREFVETPPLEIINTYLGKLQSNLD